MSCYHPLNAVDAGYYPSYEKKKVEGRGKNAKYETVEVNKRKLLIFPSDAIASIGFNEDYKGKFFQIPCGHCLGCRTDQSKEWSNRLLMESLYHKNAYFITLTYCDEYLRFKGFGADPETGEVVCNPTLYKPDVQKFVKRLRSRYNDRISYYIAGEYGDSSKRPHYHAIIFGTDDEFWKAIPCGRSETGNKYYRSPVLESLWSITDESGIPRGKNRKAELEGLSPDLIGWCSIEPANYYTFKYVSAYVTKKLGNNPNEVYYEQNIEPPFSLSSKNPAIGLQYLKDHPGILEDDRVVIGTPQGKVEFPVPKYFRKKCAETDPGLYDEITEKRKKKSNDKLLARLSETTLNEHEYLEILENNHYNRLKQRNKI